MDCISIKNLETYAYHGVYEEEQKNGQHFYVSTDLYLSTREAGIHDELQCSVHYGEVCEFINAFMNNNIYMLLEAVAENLTTELLIAYPLVEKIRLTVSKPEAPIGLPFEDVAVTIERKWNRTYVAFGSNLGEKEKNITEAIEKIRTNRFCRVNKVSEVYETAPYGCVAQEDFFNGVLELDTILSPKELLAYLQKLEADAGRERKIHWGPRTLDLDIIFYENIILDLSDLVIPHEDMQNREFVLMPMNDIAPYYRHPLFGKTVKTLLGELQSKSNQLEKADLA